METINKRPWGYYQILSDASDHEDDIERLEDKHGRV